MTATYDKSIQESFFEILGAAMHPDREMVSFSIPNTDLQALYMLSKRQGITALMRDAIVRLSTEQQLPRDLKIQWAAQTEQIEKRYRKQAAVAAELAVVFARHGIRMLILKGIGLSKYYPTPSHRECGDIDIYLFGDFEKGNRILCDAGAKIFADVPKHTEIRWKGVMIENHRTFLNVSRNREERNLDTLLGEILQQQGGVLSGAGYFTPTATFNAIYLIHHAALHFLKEGIVLRHLCDWTCFREKQWQQVDRRVFDTAMKHYGMEHFAILMTAAAIRCCGLREQSPDHDPRELERFIGEILSYKTPSNSENSFLALFQKCRAPYANRWRFEILHMSLSRYYCEAIRAQWNEKFTLFK